MEPKIRYNGYTNKWDDVCLNDIVSTAGIKNRENLPLVSFSITNDQGFVPQDDKFENGGTMRDANKSMYYIVSPKTFAYNPARINVGSIGYYDLEKDVIISSLYVVFKTDQEKCDDYYFLQWFKSDKFKRLIEQYQEGGVRLYFFYDKLCKCHVHIPSKEEQHKISSYFRVLDFKLQASAKKLESLKKLKSASLVAMFPQNGESTPKVRFKGFEGEWKETTLSECLDISYLQNSENKYDKNDVLSVSDDFGVMNQIELLGRSYAGKDVSSYSILQKGEIVYTKSPLKDKPFGIIKKNSYQTGIVSILYAVYHSKDNISADYIHYYFDPAWRLNAYMRPLVNKGAKNTMNISDEMALMGSLILPPSLAEQQAIATFFRSLDRKIALETARLEKLKQIKLACLDKMFV